MTPRPFTGQPAAGRPDAITQAKPAPGAIEAALDCMEAMSRAKYDLATRGAHGILLDAARAELAKVEERQSFMEEELEVRDYALIEAIGKDRAISLVQQIRAARAQVQP